MSELRFNELRGEEVVYAIHRQERTFLPTREHCPLCPTRPGGPPTEIPAESFEIVVFENRFPAFEEPHGTAEVVVYTDDHDLSLGSLPPSRAEALMWVWRQRYEELGAREEIDYVYVFENRGVEVGRHAAPSPRADLRLPVPAARAGAGAGGRRAPGRVRACAALNAAELADGRRLLHEDESVRRLRPAGRPLAL